jgi:hypothetical protein
LAQDFLRRFSKRKADISSAFQSIRLFRRNQTDGLAPAGNAGLNYWLQEQPESLRRAAAKASLISVGVNVTDSRIWRLPSKSVSAIATPRMSLSLISKTSAREKVRGTAINVSEFS